MTMTPEEDPAPDAHGGPRFISHLRALANITLLVTGLLFVIGWIVIMGVANSLQEGTMRSLTQGIGTIGFIAFVAFLTSIISIIIENRTDPDASEGKTP